MPGEKLTRKQAIRLKCLDCSGNNRAEVRRCPVTGCPLWPYRMGTEQKETGEDVTDTDVGDCE